MNDTPRDLVEVAQDENVLDVLRQHLLEMESIDFNEDSFFNGWVSAIEEIWCRMSGRRDTIYELMSERTAIEEG